ncbi:hypothetical protein [Bradyrhizobium sp. CCGUVB23]|uniref:hypothetical protein n=1 Tax=Bradyrhizobium sp. CCGUVB23 TaxID=2949630 RepID=UPI0020B3DF42|nr:hypothetical protein [Bradyrhizobium sp. CCGUVB23]MCP3460040.1 hypothetical protein [Bradyrhizobium sp. CCGUVB23]
MLHFAELPLVGPTATHIDFGLNVALGEHADLTSLHALVKNNPWEFLSLSALEHTAKVFERSDIAAGEYFHVIPGLKAAARVWIVRCVSIYSCLNAN